MDAESGELSGGGTLIPWFSAPLGERGELYVSAGVKTAYEQELLVIIPELFRAELEFRFGQGAAITAGRMYYSAPLDCIVQGFFDGARFSQNIGGASLYVGGWYTGLLYKKNANVAMNNADNIEYYQALDYGDFYATYFASKRMLTALGFELGGAARIQAALIGQFDLNQLDEVGGGSGRYSHLHTQYFTGRAEIPLGRHVTLEGGFALEAVESDDEFHLAAVGEAGFSLFLSSLFPDRLLVLGRYATGNRDEGVLTAFAPITVKSQGNILQGKLSGLALAQADYTARLTEYFSANLSSIFFFKEPDPPYVGQYFIMEEGGFLGIEVYGRLIWSPLSDITLNLGGGVFIPWGDVHPVWKATLSALIAVY
jgi:hypothetical protein